jgi:hypothetical protein
VMMARVLTAFSTAAMAASMLGMLLFGWAADVFTPVKSLLGASLLFLCTAGVLTYYGRRYGFPPAVEA